MLSFPEALGTVWEWLITPWALPLNGTLAALIAAVTVDPRSWLRAPVRAVGRAVVVATVWLVTVWILQQVAGSGGRGPGGSGREQAAPEKSAVVKLFIETSDGVSPDVLTVRFVPSLGDPAQAQPFCCQLVIPAVTAGGQSRQITIQETSMRGLRVALESALQGEASNVSTPRWGTAKIIPEPYPGEGPILTVFDCLKAVFPELTIERVVSGTIVQEWK